MSNPATGAFDPAASAAMAAAMAASSAVMPGVVMPGVPGATPTAAPVDMPTGGMIMPSGIKQSFNAALPAMQFTARIKRATYHTPSDVAKAANRNIRFECEIMAPDIVADPFNPTQQVKASGRVFDIYVPIAAHMKNHENSFDILGRLQLLEENGGYIPDVVLAKANQGTVWFQSLVLTEPEFYTVKGLDGKDTAVVGPDGKPMLKGFRIKLPEATQIIGRVETPPGFQPPSF